MAGCIKPIGNIESDDLNPEPSRDAERKIDITEEDQLVGLKKDMDNLRARKRPPKQFGVIARVDKYENGEARIKVRVGNIVSGDAVIPEAKKFLQANTPDPSHAILNLGRDYNGKVTTSPVIGEIVEVTIPPDGSITTPGEIVQLTGKKYFLPVKVTEEGLDLSAKNAVDDGQEASTEGAASDNIGSGEMDPSTQVPPTLDTPELEPLPDEEAVIDSRDDVRLIFQKSIPNGIRIVVENQNSNDLNSDLTDADLAAKDEYKYEIDASAYIGPRFIAQEVIEGDALNPKDTRYIYFCEAK